MKLNFKTPILALALAVQTHGVISVEASERVLDAHEHGVSKLKLAQESNTIIFELEAPGNDIVGFEHAAENDDQKSAVNEALSQLQKPELIFVLPADAKCTASNQKAEFETEEDHAGFHVTWTMTCERPAKANAITVRFFETFERAEEVELEAIGNSGQVAIEVEKGQAKVDISQAIGE